jgi:hypothetical protein
MRTDVSLFKADLFIIIRGEAFSYRNNKLLTSETKPVLPGA